jgi:hypothetical protein
MHEITEPISVTESNLANVLRNVLTTAYLANISFCMGFRSRLRFLDPSYIPTGEGKYKFAGKTLADQGIILVSIDLKPETGIGKCSVNCENTILGGLLLKGLVDVLIRE